MSSFRFFSATGPVAYVSDTEFTTQSWNAILAQVPGASQTDIFSVIFNNGATSIGGDFFKDCIRLVDVILPNTLTSIGDSSFRNCDSLSRIILPNSLTTIFANCFFGCNVLTSVTLPTNSSFTNISQGMFEGCISLTTISIPSSVTSLGSFVFRNCSKLNRVIIPNNSLLNYIGADCFRNCTLLDLDFIVPPGVTSIGPNCFSGCTVLSNFTITNYRNLQSTWSDIFTGCGGLRRLTYWNCPANPPNPLSSAAINLNTAAQSANFNNIFPVYNTSAFTATNVVFGSGSIKEDFCNSDGVKLCSLIACDGEIILTDDSLIDGYIIKTIISTFNKLKEIPYSDVIFESIKNNLTIYLANEQLVQLINKKYLN